MASEELKLSVAVEVAIHNAVRQAVQEIFDTYGVRIDSASINWNDISTIAKVSYIVDEVRLVSTMKGGNHGQSQD